MDVILDCSFRESYTTVHIHVVVGPHGVLGDSFRFSPTSLHLSLDS